MFQGEIRCSIMDREPGIATVTFTQSQRFIHLRIICRRADNAQVQPVTELPWRASVPDQSSQRSRDKSSPGSGGQKDVHGSVSFSARQKCATIHPFLGQKSVIMILAG